MSGKRKPLRERAEFAARAEAARRGGAMAKGVLDYYARAWKAGYETAQSDLRKRIPA